MSVILRNILDQKMNLDTSELISDDNVMRAYLDAARYYRKYILFPRTNSYRFSITNGDYLPEFDMDQVVTITDKDGNKVTKDLSKEIDTQTKVFNGSGTYWVTIALNINNAYLTDLPPKLEDLFYFRCLYAIGQKLKFATYQTQPFTIDAQAIFAEGQAGIEKTEQFIMINRDEDPDNISNLRGESYRGIQALRNSGNVTYLW